MCRWRNSAFLSSLLAFEEIESYSPLVVHYNKENHLGNFIEPVLVQLLFFIHRLLRYLKRSLYGNLEDGM